MAEVPRSQEIGSHLQRMSCYCALIAERLEHDADLIRIASRLHDVGMAAVNSAPHPKKHTTIGRCSYNQPTRYSASYPDTYAYPHVPTPHPYAGATTCG
jgi:HD superfamily phosphodiesterase